MMVGALREDRSGVIGVDVVGHPLEVEVLHVADGLRAAVGEDGFNLHRLATQVEVRLEVGDDRVLAQDVEALPGKRRSSARCRGRRCRPSDR